MDFAILILIAKFLKAILATPLKKIYIYYSKFEIFLLNSL